MKKDLRKKIILTSFLLAFMSAPNWAATRELAIKKTPWWNAVRVFVVAIFEKADLVPPPPPDDDTTQTDSSACIDPFGRPKPCDP